MPAYFESGFCVREPSWHGQETLLDDYPADWTEARKLAGLEWEPVIVPSYRAVEWAPVERPVEGGAEGETTLVMEPTRFEEVTTSRFVERDDTRRVIGQGMTDQFALITHAEMGQIMEAILGQTNVKYETAGVVKQGEQVWVLVRLDEPRFAPGDVVNGEPVATFPFLALINSHNGSGSCKVTLTQVRVVCWNTIQMADAEGNRHGRQFSFRHVGKPMERIADAVAALNGLREEADKWQEVMTELYGIPVDEEFRNRFVSEFIPMPAAGLVSDRVMGNVRRDQQTFMRLLTEEPTNAEQAHTGLGVFNAAVEFLDWKRGYRSSDTLLGRQMLRPEPMKAKSLKLIRELATVN